MTDADQQTTLDPESMSSNLTIIKPIYCAFATAVQLVRGSRAAAGGEGRAGWEQQRAVRGGEGQRGEGRGGSNSGLLTGCAALHGRGPCLGEQ